METSIDHRALYRTHLYDPVGETRLMTTNMNQAYHYSVAKSVAAERIYVGGAAAGYYCTTRREPSGIAAVVSAKTDFSQNAGYLDIM